LAGLSINKEGDVDEARELLMAAIFLLKQLKMKLDKKIELEKFQCLVKSFYHHF
jgi:hypothetical protein